MEKSQSQVPLSAPGVWRFVTVDSCLDTAHYLAAQHKLRVWDSVQVYRQTAGRGQLRRHWLSPPGNIYAALRLPKEPPFDGTAASPAIGFLLADALRRMGWPVFLKWPNDLVLSGDAGPGKVAGILLEERGETLLAGIGINLYSAPGKEQMRPGAALPGACLFAEEKAHMAIPAEMLWQALVKQAFSAYDIARHCTEQWHVWISTLLLWHGHVVELRDGAQTVCGRLEGLAPNGAVRLLGPDGFEERLSGSLALTESGFQRMPYGSGLRSHHCCKP